jgi:hypothetical protein
MAEVEGGEGVMEPGRAKVERVPLGTYDFTSAGGIATSSRKMGCRFIERGNF